VRCRRVINKLIPWHTDRHLFGAIAVELDWTPGTPAGTTPVILNSYRATEVEKNGRLKEETAILQESGSGFVRLYPLKVERPESWLIDVDDRRYRGGILRTLIFHEVLIEDNL